MSLETDRIPVATPQAGKVEMAGSDTGYFEGRLSGQADLGDEPAADAASATASITADNVHFVSGIEKSSVAAQLTGRWADITLYVAPADAEQICAADFMVLEVTAIEDDAGNIDLWGTAEAVLDGEILQAVAADDFAVCLQVVTNFPGSVIVDAVDIAFGATPAADNNDNGEDTTDSVDDASPSLTTASMRVLEVGDFWTYDEQHDGTVDGETAVSATGTNMVTVLPDTIVDGAGNTAGTLSSRLELISEDGTEAIWMSGMYFSQDSDGTFYQHGRFIESIDPPIEFLETPSQLLVQVPAEGKFRTVKSPVAIGDTNHWDILYNNGATMIGQNDYVGIEPVAVPAGQFVAARYESSFTETTAETIASFEITAWLVPELGLEVKLIIDATTIILDTGVEIIGHVVRELTDTNVPFSTEQACPDDDGDGRVMICHRPPGNPDNARTITVGADASAAHLAHGDFCGSCS